jgi:hypothetical protein
VLLAATNCLWEQAVREVWQALCAGTVSDAQGSSHMRASLAMGTMYVTP